MGKRGLGRERGSKQTDAEVKGGGDDTMNAPLSFVRRALLQYRDKYFETKPFRPVVHVMWTIGVSMAWYEGYHHRHLEKLHTEAAEVKRTELKEKHGAALRALEDHNGEITKAQDFIKISKSAIEGARHHIKDLAARKKELEKTAEEAKV